jgi:diamine N-acetyltransferase
LCDDSDKPEYYLWRLMIGDGHQRQGYGRRALELLVEYVRTRPNATELLTSYVPADGGPEPFYRRLGFIDTGKIDDGAVVIKLAL